MLYNPVEVNLKLEITAKSIVAYMGPGYNYPAVGIQYKKGDIITSIAEHNGWYKVKTDSNTLVWINNKNGKNAKVIANNSSNTKNVTNSVGTINSTPSSTSSSFESTITDNSYANENGYVTENVNDGILDFNAYTYGLYNGSSYTTRDGSKLTTIKGIHGMPYQFMSSTDIKLSELAGVKFPYGRVFIDRIINKMPLLLLSPGSPVFLEGFSKKTKESILSMLADSVSGKQTELEKILSDGDNGRYYSFRFNYKDYYDYVNAMCRASAIYLGIQDRKLDGRSYKYYDWSTYVNDGLKGFFSGSEYVCFYIDAETQITDSFSNTTGESMLDTGLNKLSDIAKEVGFLLGATAGLKFNAMEDENYQETFEGLSKIIGSYSNPSNIIERLKHGAITVAGGGELIFPEIWKDSTYSKSYDVTIRLNSPDGDTESIYRNILVPLWHLIGLSLPLQMGINGFKSPFLIQAFYKGLINCEMGIVTGLSIRKGAEGSWNIDGLPTEVEVSLSFKDLYQILTLTKATDVKMLVNNTQLMDFIATMCGIVLNKPEILRKIEMYSTLQLNKVINLPTRVGTGIKQTVSNILLKSIGFK